MNMSPNLTWTAVREQRGTVAASSKDTADGMAMARSASNIAYSAKLPGRGFPHVAISTTDQTVPSTSGQVKLTALIEASHSVSNLPLSDPFAELFDGPRKVTAHDATWRRDRTPDVQRIYGVQCERMNFDATSLSEEGTQGKASGLYTPDLVFPRFWDVDVRNDGSVSWSGDQGLHTDLTWGCNLNLGQWRWSFKY